MPQGDPLDRPLWLEQAAAAWTRRRSRSGAAAVASGCILLVGALDGGVARLVGFDFVTTVLYIVPVGFAAWAAGARAGIACSGFAAAVEAAVTWWASRGAIAPWILAVSIALELLVFLGAAFAFARLRWHLDHHRMLSRTDPLTGVGNARSFDEAIEQELERMGRAPTPLSIVYFDVDHFKGLNDSRGHVAGNELLRLVGETMRASVRATDSVARVGGDEFAVLLPRAGQDGCRLAVERLRQRLSQALRLGGFANTLSAGAVTFDGPPPLPGELLAAADRAMYQVKHGRRDGVHYEVVAASASVAAAGAARRASHPPAPEGRGSSP